MRKIKEFIEFLIFAICMSEVSIPILIIVIAITAVLTYLLKG